MGVLEGQEHVLEDGQGGAPDNGIQKLGENLEKKKPGQESHRPGPPKAKCSHRPERGPETLESKQQTHEGARTQRCSQTWVDGQPVKWTARRSDIGWMDGPKVTDAHT